MESTTTPAPDPKLKAFLSEHFPFAAFKQMGLFTGLKHTDYDGQAARVCEHFGYESAYEYGREVGEIVAQTETAALGYFPDVVTAAGELERGGGFLLSLAPTPKPVAYECPACSCPGETSILHTRNVTCQGCKRKLRLTVSGGELTVAEA